MRGFVAFGKQVKDAAGEHFADAATELAAALIVAALNFRNHRPVIEDGEIVCSRCGSILPGEGDEPCVAKPSRCNQTPDLFEEAMPHSGTEHRRCIGCGAHSTMVINDEPMCHDCGAAKLKAAVTGRDEKVKA